MACAQSYPLLLQHNLDPLSDFRSYIKCDANGRYIITPEEHKMLQKPAGSLTHKEYVMKPVCVMGCVPLPRGYGNQLIAEGGYCISFFESY